MMKNDGTDTNIGRDRTKKAERNAIGRTAELWLRAVISGEKCVVCGERSTKGESLFCAGCTCGYNDARESICMDCGAMQDGCFCVPPELYDAGCHYLIKLGGYGSGDEATPIDGMVLRLKAHRDRMLADFIAEVLGKTIENVMRQRGIGTGECLIAWVPRDRKRIRETGFDQARLLAGAFSRETGITAAGLLTRTRGGEQQKKLGIEARKTNAAGLFDLTPGAEENIAGRTVFLTDDLVTTGATMSECCRLLIRAGAREVIGVCIGRTPLKRRNGDDGCNEAQKTQKNPQNS